MKAQLSLLLLSFLMVSGCATWKPQRWSVESLRDERAVDIDERLSSDEPIIDNPFRKADADAE